MGYTSTLTAMSDARAPTSLTRALAARLLRRGLGGAWRIANGGGSHGNTRRAARGDLSVVVKLGQPASALRRLAELEVTPPILAWGEHDGSPYTVQRLVAGHHPDTLVTIRSCRIGTRSANRGQAFNWACRPVAMIPPTTTTTAPRISATIAR